LYCIAKNHGILQFTNPDNPTIRGKNYSISCTEMKFVQFGLFLSKFGCHGNFLGSFEILGSIFESADPE